jgi:hypothetical protein
VEAAIWQPGVAIAFALRERGVPAPRPLQVGGIFREISTSSRFHVAAGVVDVGLQQDRVARGLVELDPVIGRKDALELGAVVAGRTAHDRQARRVEDELVSGTSQRLPRSRLSRVVASPDGRNSAGSSPPGQYRSTSTRGVVASLRISTPGDRVRHQLILGSIWRRATSSEAMICRFGEVDA